MVRVAFTVALLVAVLAVSTAAIDAAAVHRSDTRARAVVDRLVSEARALAANNGAVPADAGPARRVVEVRLPAGGFASAELRSFDVGPPPDTNASAAVTQFAWRVEGGTRHTVSVADLRVRPASGAADRVAGGGTIEFVLRLVERDGRRVVVLDRRGT